MKEGKKNFRSKRIYMEGGRGHFAALREFCPKKAIRVLIIHLS